MPNALAYLALFAWPGVAFLLFRILPTRDAILWTILAGYLVLPERVAVDLPMLPAFDKTFIPAATATLLCLTRLRNPLELLPRGLVPMALTLVFLLAPFATVATNREALFYGPTVLPGLRPYDAFSFGLSHAVLIVPFLLGQRFFRDEGALRLLLTAIAVAGLAYTLPALLEVRLSPQLHRWAYGFHPHQFLQQMRGDGFRPMVFLTHGLKVALFMAMALIAAAALWRGHAAPAKARWAAASVWLAMTLVLCKTVAAWAYAVVFAPLVLVAGRRLQRLALLGVALTVLAYPMLRGADLVPTGRLVATAEAISPQRAYSLGFRFRHEDALLARANLKPLFGWGGFSRSRVFDAETGRDISVTDGSWVITVGQYGWVGYMAEFGLLTWPLLLLGATRAGRRAPFAAIALALVLAANLTDLLPNSGMTPLTWLIAGSLSGMLRATRRASAPGAPARPGRAAAPAPSARPVRPQPRPAP